MSTRWGVCGRINAIFDLQISHNSIVGVVNKLANKFLFGKYNLLSFTHIFVIICTLLILKLLLYLKQMAGLVLEHMKEGGTRVYQGVTPQVVAKLDNGRLRVSWQDVDEEFDTVLLAVGKFTSISV